MFKRGVSNLSSAKWQFSLGSPRFVRGLSTAYTNKHEGLDIQLREDILWIKFDRPQKYNAILGPMFKSLTEIFAGVNKDASVKALVLTGNGEYYSSGNDLTNFMLAMKDSDGPKEGLRKMKEILLDFVDSMICLEKFLIAAVNGPAVGIPVTTLPLCDYVIASDKATFQSPFTALGQVPEACSSVTLPQMCGRVKASELLLLNMTWDAHKAQRNGLVAEVIEHNKFQHHLETLLQETIKSCYPNSLKFSKSLVQNPNYKQTLLEANRRECEAIYKAWLGPECMDAVQKFLNRTKK